MSALPLRSAVDAINFRLANDMIEQLNEVARLSRAIAKASGTLNEVKMSDTPPEPAAVGAAVA
jgi:phosphate:Na+ symporter